MSQLSPVSPDRAPGPVARNATRRPLLRRWFAVGLLLLSFLAGAAVLGWALDMTLGRQVTMWAAVAAVVPLALVLPAFLWLDRVESEPLSSILLAFGWGALVATSISLIVNSAAASLLASLGFDSPFLPAVAVAPVVEEVTKGAGILVVLVLRRREFDGVVDGIVYAGVIAAGFAFGENILYLGQALIEGGAGALAVTFALRGVMSPFAHPLFTMWTGVGVGVLVTGRSAVRVLAPFGGLILAMVVHAAWNAGAFLGLTGWIGSYMLMQVPVFLLAIGVALWARRRESRAVAAHLTHYVDHGLMTSADPAMMQTSAGRREARRWAAEVGGRPAARAMRDYQDDGVELALLRARMLRGTAGPDAAAEEAVLIESLRRARMQFTLRSSARR